MIERLDRVLKSIGKLQLENLYPCKNQLHQYHYSASAANLCSMGPYKAVKLR